MWLGFVNLGPDPLLRPSPDGSLSVRAFEALLTSSPAAIYGWAIEAGYSKSEAGSLAAWRVGIRIVDEEREPLPGWPLPVVLHLAWLRWMVSTGRLDGPTG